MRSIPLAAALAIVAAALAPAAAGECALNELAAPKTPFFLKGVVRGPASDEEVRSQTAIAVARVHAPESPAYVHLPRMFVIYLLNGVKNGTIAAVTDGSSPKPGDIVKLASRRRDPDQPCAFIPWTIVGGATAVAPSRPSSDGMGAIFVPVHRRGANDYVPVTLNGQITLEFEIDSGASVVTTPAAVVEALQRGGTLGQRDVLGQTVFTIADGSKHVQSVLRLHSVAVGGRTLFNVQASGGPPGSPLLLGQSFLGRFSSWSIDDARSALVLK